MAAGNINAINMKKDKHSGIDFIDFQSIHLYDRYTFGSAQTNLESIFSTLCVEPQNRCSECVNSFFRRHKSYTKYLLINDWEQTEVIR